MLFTCILLVEIIKLFLLEGGAQAIAVELHYCNYV